MPDVLILIAAVVIGLPLLCVWVWLEAKLFRDKNGNKSDGPV